MNPEFELELAFDADIEASADEEVKQVDPLASDLALGCKANWITFGGTDFTDRVPG